MTTQWIYLDTTAKHDLTDRLDHPPDDDTIRAHLGGTGLGMIRAEEAGLPIPPRVVVAAGASLIYLETGAFPDGLDDQLESGIRTLEARTGKTFGGTENPLIVHVQSAPRRLMPGVMRTLDAVGLTTDTCAALVDLSGDAAFFHRMLAHAVVAFAGEIHGIDRARFDAAWEGWGADRSTWDWRTIAASCLDLYRQHVGEPYPQDPYRQLRLALGAVFRAWEDPRAVRYREQEGIPHDWGVAAGVASWVFGNLGPESGMGSVFSRHPVTGEPALYGGYVPGCARYNGSEVYDVLVPDGLASLRARHPGVHAALVACLRRVEAHDRDVQDVEFCVEQGRLWVLSARSAKRSPRAALRIVRDMVDEGLLAREEACRRLHTNGWIPQLRPEIPPETASRARASDRLLAQGWGVSAGAVVGAVAFDAETARAYAEAGRAVILVRETLGLVNYEDLFAVQGVVLQAVPPMANSAVACLGVNLPAVTTLPEMEIDAAAGTARVGDRVIREGDVITLDGLTGELLLGPVPLTPSPVLETLRALCPS
jgi:pyruvate,orthophosphate dikinase